MKSTNPRAKSLKNKTVLHIVTGSIAACKAGDLIKGLRGEGARVVCVLTKTAERFVTPTTLRALTGEFVYTDFFANDTGYGVVHTSLEDQAHALVVAPASANFIARLAAGMADDLPSCLILATRKPVLIAPAMNDRMFEHPLTQRNIRTLRETGYHFVDPVVGGLACGRRAVGHIAEAADIVQKLRTVLKK